MALFYVKRESSITNKAGNKVFYPQAVHKGSVRLPQIAREVAEYSSLTAGDVQNTIENLIRVMGNHMRSSEVVYLDGLGSFRITMSCTGKALEDITKVSPAQATLTVRFRPERTQNPDRTVATRSMVTGTKCILFDPKSNTTTDETDDTNTGSTTPDTGSQGGDNTGTGGDNTGTGGNQGSGDDSMD